MCDIDYIAPASTNEVLDLLATQPAARVIAGGTDLLVQMRAGLRKPDILVDLCRLDLDDIAVEPDVIRIGSCVTHAEIAGSEILNRHCPALAAAAKLVGGPSTRSRGTLGGNLVNASPSADAIPPLLAYDAEVEFAGLQGQNKVPLAEFYAGYRETVMTPNQILTSVYIPVPPQRTVAHFVKYGNRRALYIAVVSVAVRVSVDHLDRVTVPRVVLGAVGPTVKRCEQAERVLTGEKLTDTSITAAAKAAEDAALPISDKRASAEYRRKLVYILVRRALWEAKTKLSESEQDV